MNHSLHMSTFPNDKFKTLSNSKCLQMTILNMTKMAESSLKPVKNTVGNGETACYEQFLHFPQYLQKDLNCRHIKTRACLGKGCRYITVFQEQSNINEASFQCITGKNNVA